MNNTYFEEIKLRVIRAADQTNCNADEKDIKRNHTNYGTASAFLSILGDFGHDIDLPVWEDENGCLRIPFVKIDDKKIEFINGK